MSASVSNVGAGESVSVVSSRMANFRVVMTGSPTRFVLRPSTTLRRRAITWKEPHPHKKCPAKDASCHRCNKKGYHSSHCFSKWVSEVSSENVLNTAFLDTIGGEQISAWFTIKARNKIKSQYWSRSDWHFRAILPEFTEATTVGTRENSLWALTTAPEDPWTVLGKVFAQCAGAVPSWASCKNGALHVWSFLPLKSWVPSVFAYCFLLSDSLFSLLEDKLRIKLQLLWESGDDR